MVASPLIAVVERPAVAAPAAVAAGMARVAVGPPAVRLAGLGLALPPHPVDADELGRVLARVWPHRARHLPALVRELAGSRRWLARPPADLGRGMTLAEQGLRYPELATELAAAACRHALSGAGVPASAVDLLVVASCTGFVLPGPDSRLVAALGLREDVTRLPLTQLGCAAGAAGLGRAAEWLRGAGRPDRPGIALVAAVELPSLTFQPGDDSVDNLLSALVFGDGAGAAVLIGPGGDGHAGGLDILRTGERLVPASGDALGYRLDDHGFRVHLVRDLPERLAAVLPDVVATFLAPDRAPDCRVVAAHPGGPRIIDAVARSLEVGEAAVAASRAAFDRAANPSSAGVFFVLDAAMHPSPPAGTRGLLLGLGPGLTLELLELRWPAPEPSR